MRLKACLAVLGAVGGALLLAAPASAVECPPGTDARTVRVGDQTRTVCVPGIYCFPLGCDPWLS